MTPAWRPTTAFLVAVTVGLGLLLLAPVTHRPALALLAVPLIADAAWALRRVERAPVTMALRPEPARVREGDDVDLQLTVHAPVDADVVLTALETRPLLGTYQPLRPRCTLPAAATRDVAARAARWGLAPAGQVYTTAWAGHGLLRSAAVLGVGEPVVVEPGPVGVDPPAPTSRTGVVGPRMTRRHGEGSEFTAVRPFVAGDRLRHVHWRVTARRGDLHVTTTTADREAAVLLAVDSGSELGPRDATSLDVAVRVAAAYARRHLHDGDRVGLVDLAEPTRVLRPGTGRRQLDRVVDGLVRIRRRTPADLRRWPTIVARAAPGASVVVFSPLLRPVVGTAVAVLARSGVAVTVVDTLDHDVDRATLPAAHRLLLLDRDVTLDRLAEVGVAVTRWR